MRAIAQHAQRGVAHAVDLLSNIGVQGVQARDRHTGHCPTGVTTQDPLRQKAPVVPTRADRVFMLHSETLTFRVYWHQASAHTCAMQPVVAAEVPVAVAA